MDEFDDKQRKSGVKDDDDDDDLMFSDEEEEEDEDDIRGAPKKKKSKGSEFVMMEAEEDDEEEEEDDDLAGDAELFEGGAEDIGGMDDGGAAREASKRRQQEFRDANPADLEKMAERYQLQPTSYDSYDDIIPNSKEGEALKQSLLPTTHDPNIWQIRCKEGRETEVVRSLLAKFLISEKDTEKPEDKLRIYSAHCVEGDKGRVYVEARKESHIKIAVAQVPHVRINSPFVLLNRIEMPRVLVAPERVIVKLMDWVRIKSGVYRDDLAQIYELGAHDTVSIRLVPRIQKDAYKTSRGGSSHLKKKKKPGDPDDDDDLEKISEGGGGAKRKARSNIRPPQVMFNFEEAMQGSSHPSGDESKCTWLGNEYRNGFLIKRDVRVNTLQTKNVVPTQDELSRFRQGIEKAKAMESKMDVDGDEEMRQHELGMKDPSVGKSLTFAKGDKIQVTKGEYVSIIGVVTGGDSNNVEFRPEDTETFGRKILAVPSNHLRKYFSVGSRVKILGEMNRGETGVVTAVEDDTAIIYADTAHKEIRALMNDLQISHAIGTGNAHLGVYELFDLVQVGDAVGVIVEVEKEGFQILSENGQVSYKPISELGARRNTRFGSTTDAHNNPVSIGDAVRIIEGPHKDLNAILKHISKSIVFVHCSNGVRENRGMVCLRRHHIASLSDKFNASIGINSNGQNPNAFGSGNNNMLNSVNRQVVVGMGGVGGTSLANRNFSGPKRIDPSLLKKEVVVVRGQWKGQRGKVIEGGGDRDYRVELFSGSRIVKVPREDVKPASDIKHPGPISNNNFGPWNSFNNRDSIGSQTPMRIQTPHHNPSFTSHDDYLGNAPSSNNPSRMNNPSAIGNEFDPNFKVGTLPPNSSTKQPSSSMPMPQTPASANFPAPLSSMPFTVPQTPAGAYVNLAASTGLVPSTPAVTGGHAPFTPAMGAPYSSYTMPFTPFNAAMPQTPASAAPFTPAPGPSNYTPYTPANVPFTPGAGMQVPYTPATPHGASGGYHAPYTPANVPFTPVAGQQIPNTPFTPATPSMWHSMGSSTDQLTSSQSISAGSSAASDPDPWCQPGYEVYDPSIGLSKRYVIIDSNRGQSSAKVAELLADGTRSTTFDNLAKSSLKLVVPQKRDTVAIVGTGSIGVLVGVDEQEHGGGSGIIKKQDDNSVHVHPLSSFAKYHAL